MLLFHKYVWFVCTHTQVCMISYDVAYEIFISECCIFFISIQCIMLILQSEHSHVLTYPDDHKSPPQLRMTLLQKWPLHGKATIGNVTQEIHPPFSPMRDKKQAHMSDKWYRNCYRETQLSFNQITMWKKNSCKT